MATSVSGTAAESLRKDAILEVGVRKSSRASSSVISCHRPHRRQDTLAQHGRHRNHASKLTSGVRKGGNTSSRGFSCAA
jgi:hypothetical protein